MLGVLLPVIRAQKLSEVGSAHPPRDLDPILFQPGPNPKLHRSWPGGGCPARAVFSLQVDPPRIPCPDNRQVSSTVHGCLDLPTATRFLPSSQSLRQRINLNQITTQGRRDHQGFPDAAACPARGPATRPGRERRCLCHLGRGAAQLGTRRGIRFDRRGCCRADPGPQRCAARTSTACAGTLPHAGGAKAPAASRWQSHLGSRAPARTCAGRKRLPLDTLQAWDTRLPRAPPFSAG